MQPSLLGCALALAPCALALAACDSTPPAGTDAGADAGMPDSGPGDAGSVGCEMREVTCVDESISQLDLFDTPSPAVITEEGTTAGEFLTHIDTTGGGFMPSQSFVYARFTDTGLMKVEIGDEDAFASSDWDISMRRFIVRINTGVSGPSCVRAARTAPGTTFDELTSVPADLSYRDEVYFGDTCELVPDGSGLPGSPATALSSYWTYPGCVQMTDNVYVVQLANGRHVKLQVISYYGPEAQEQCDTMGTVPMPSTAGNLRIRWAFLD